MTKHQIRDVIQSYGMLSLARESAKVARLLIVPVGRRASSSALFSPLEGI